MRKRPRVLALENLEPRLNLSSLATAALPPGPGVIATAVVARWQPQTAVSLLEPWLSPTYALTATDAIGPASHTSKPATGASASTTKVTAVYASSTAWTSTMLNALAASGQGSATLGYAIPTGSAGQFAPLAWGNLNEISITFSQNVTIAANALQVSGYNVPVYAIAGFSYNSSSHTATWTFANAFKADNVQLTLSANAVTDGSGNSLDGEWTDGVSTTSGNGTPGGNFTFHMEILPGDIDQDGTVSINDLAVFSTNWQQPTTSPGRGDLNGDGFVDINDLSILAADWQVSVTVPAIPTNVTFSNVGSTALTVNWTDSAANVSGISIYRSSDGVNFAPVASLAANATSFNDSGLAAGTTYYYQVAANFKDDAGAATAGVASTTTQAVAPAAPSGLAFTNVTSTTLTLGWNDNSGNESGFYVYRSTDNVNYARIAALAANAVSYNDSGLTAGTTYYYEVAAYNGAGSGVSAAASMVTQPFSAVAIATKNMTSFTELDITGSSASDMIVVTQSNNILTITGNGQITTLANTYGDIVIHGGNGNDNISVASSVNIATLIYGGDGNDTIVNDTSGKATIVTVGNGVNTVTGNGINTSYWVNPNDTVNASATEIANGAVNRVSNWYQPSIGAVPRGLYGQNLVDPTDSGTEYRLTANSFWGTGPVITDINQGQLSDCYFLAPLASLANNETVKFMNTGVDLGDGTYAVRFVRNGVTTYVRVDGDLSSTGYAHPGASGNLWGALYEKAYAFFRTGACTYSSLNWGYPTSTFSDLGLSNSSVNAFVPATQLLSVITSALGSNRAVVATSNGTITDGDPIVGSHVYSIMGAYLDTSGTLQIMLRNPWGFYPNSDGLITLSYTNFGADFSMVTYTTV